MLAFEWAHDALWIKPTLHTVTIIICCFIRPILRNKIKCCLFGSRYCLCRCRIIPLVANSSRKNDNLRKDWIRLVWFSVWVSAGIITLSKWCEAMETATHLGLPWRLLREKLAPIQSEAVPTDVHYTLTLQMLDTDLIVSTCNCKCI